MKVKILSGITSWKTYRNLKAGKVYEIPPEDAQELIQGGQAAEVVEEFLGEGTRKRIEAEAKRPTLGKLEESPKPGEKMIDPQTESRLRRIAHTQGFDEDAFLREYGRLISEGQPKQDALSQAMGLFEKGAYKAEKKPTLADYLPEKLEGPAPPPEPEEKPKPEEKKKAEIDPELAGWLSSRGFTLGPEGVAFTRTEKLETGDVVKLQVDFSDTPKGTRYGYRLDMEDPPKWRPDKALRDHPTLLQFKRFRDDLLAQRERAKVAPPKDKPTEVPAGGSTKLALLPPEVEEAEEMEHRDEQMIIRELKGDLKVLERALADYFYSFELRGRTVIGLSYAGVKAIIRRMGHIEIIEIKVEEKPRSWFVLVKARDKLKDLEAYGAAIQPKQFQGGGENPFALTVAVSKAQRNAWRHFIDEKVVTETYRAWLEGRGK